MSLGFDIVRLWGSYYLASLSFFFFFLMLSGYGVVRFGAIEF